MRAIEVLPDDSSLIEIVGEVGKALTLPPHSVSLYLLGLNQVPL